MISLCLRWSSWIGSGALSVRVGSGICVGLKSCRIALALHCIVGIIGSTCVSAYTCRTVARGLLRVCAHCCAFKQTCNQPTALSTTRDLLSYPLLEEPQSPQSGAQVARRQLQEDTDLQKPCWQWRSLPSGSVPLVPDPYWRLPVLPSGHRDKLCCMPDLKGARVLIFWIYSSEWFIWKTDPNINNDLRPVWRLIVSLI